MDYDKLNVTDSLAVVGELEHMRRHLLRSVQYADEDDKIFYLVTAKQCQEMRRKYMAKHFPVDTKLWCLVKSAATLRQLLYETTSDDVELLKEIDTLVDDIMEKATGKDLSECESCRQDKEK